MRDPVLSTAKGRVGLSTETEICALSWSGESLGARGLNYYLDLFTPRTWSLFREHGEDISGFRLRQQTSAAKIKPGDIFLCYLVRVSRWAGALEITSEFFLDDTPIFDDPDPYQVRFKVRPIITFPLEQAVPIDAESLWERLSFTKDIGKRSVGWAQHANLRASLRTLTAKDGGLILETLQAQAKRHFNYALTPAEQRRIATKTTIRTADRAVIVEIPDQEEEDEEQTATALGVALNHRPEEDARESHRIQATLADIGAKMGFRIWIPRGDRQKILELVPKSSSAAFLEALPLNYDDATLRTVEQIDVIWLKNRSMARAFEVEHTTAIYSGLLRMADLLALQPNMNIRLHIVAPSEKREKVLREIRRPVFSLLDRGPLYESCSFIPYEAVHEIAANKHLAHMSDTLVDEYEESAQDD